VGSLVGETPVLCVWKKTGSHPLHPWVRGSAHKYTHQFHDFIPMCIERARALDVT